MRREILVLCCGLLVGGVSFCSAQIEAGVPVDRGREYNIESRVLGERRVIEVALPGGYEANPDQRYPVLVVLDGEFEHNIAAAIARFYATMSQLPPMIVVGVRNTDRMRDLTPLATEGFNPPPEAATSGGADRFLAFLAEELVPYLDQRYRTAPMRVLVGHSLGGLFALHVLGTRPELFTGYLVMEPSVWWNNGRELNQVRTVLGQPAARRSRVMMVNTTPLGIDTTQWGGAFPMVREFRITGETHASMAMAGMMQGLRTMFADFRPSEWRPGTRPLGMLARYDSLSERVGYAVPVPEQSFGQVVRMSIHSRFFEDAEQALDRMERTLGPSGESRDLRDMLAEKRGAPQPPGFIPLEIPSRRPSPREARAFLGRWTTGSQTSLHEVEVRAAGDTIVLHDRVRLRNGEWYEADSPVIQVTQDGTLEWGLRWFRGIAALVVLRGRLLEDGTMRVSREVRGWVPDGPAGDLTQIQLFRRITP